jgi:hypothetical protein
MKLNRDTNRLNEIIGDSNFCSQDYSGGVRRYKGLTYDMINLLSQEGFIDWNEHQNSSPTIFEFYTFMRYWPEMTAHGYIVHSDRSDYRLSIEGLEFNENVNEHLMRAFTNLCRGADEFICESNHLYSWWD